LRLIDQTAEHFEELGGNPMKGFLVGGISAGANFSSILALLARDDKLSPPLTGTYLSILPSGPPDLFPKRYRDLHLSREQNKNAPILNNVAMALFDSKSPSHYLKLALTNKENYNPDPKSPYRSPLLFESHKDLPPTYFQVCGMDPLRDDALIYERMLSEENGVKTKVDIYPGLPHGFWSVWVEAEFSKELRKDSVKGMKWLLEQSK
jgi:acetyl esterase/lipase